MAELASRIKWYYEMCRQCGREEETVPHILNHCIKNGKKMTERHDEVIRQLVDKVPPKWDVRVNRRVEGGTSRKRPDLVITETPGGTKHIIDVTVPYDDAMEAARKKKLSKYRDVAVEQALRLGGKTEVTLDPLVIGSRGTWDKRNDQLLSRLKIPPRGIDELKKTMTGAVCEKSMEIYEGHV